MKKRSIIDKLNYSQKQLIEYSKLTPDQRLETFTTILGPAISRIYNVLNQISNHKYPQMEDLNKAFLLTDVHIITYYDSTEKLTYIHLRRALKLKQPENIEIVDKRSGKCRKSDGTIFFSTRIAIDYSLDVLCKHWLKEIPIIIDSLPKSLDI